MRIESFQWNEWNIDHIAKHSVTPREVEEACYNPNVIRKTRDGFYQVFGQTDAGRYLLIIVRYESKDVIYVITARPMTKKEQQYYRNQR